MDFWPRNSYFVSTLISPADIQAIMASDPHNVTSVWTQANISLVPYGLNMLPTFTADIVTVSTPIGSPVLFQDRSSPDYVNILAAAKNPNADINVYYVPGLTDGTNPADGLTIPGTRDSLVDAHSRISRAHVTAHEIGHGLGLSSTAIPIQADYHDPNRMYELMFWRTADYVGSVLTYSGFSVVPYQGLIVNP